MTPLIADTAHLQAFHRPGRSDQPLLVTFNELGMTADGRHFWGQSVCERLDLPAIGIVSRTPNWFPAADMAQLAAVVAPILDRHPLIVTYGHSQGGYGAIKYAGLLRAGHVAAFCPQATIEPAVLGAADSRFSSYYRADLHEGMAVKPGDCPVPAVVVYDPRMKQDRLHVGLLADVVAVRPVTVPHSGHGAVRLVAGAEPFAAFLDLLCRGADMAVLFRTLRKQSPMVRATLLQRRSDQLAQRGRNESAKAMALAAAAAAPADFDVQLGATQALARLGFPDEALSLALALVARWPDSHHALAHLAFLQGLAGEVTAAVASLERAIAIRPEISSLHSRLGALLERQGRRAEALAAARRAVELGPCLAHNHAALADLLLAQGQDDQAVDAISRAIALSPHEARWLNHRAMIMTRLGRRDEAVADILAAIALAPDDQGLVRHLARIRGG